jgi:hypothetical protein
MPDARFAHPTQHVLISSNGVQVEKTEWWPVLNGKDIFRDGKTTSIASPIAVQ